MQALLTLCLLAPAPEVKDAVKIEGTWIVSSAIENGKEKPHLNGNKFTFKAGKLTIMGKEEFKAVYKMDPSAKPKRLDWRTAGEVEADAPSIFTVAVIYKFEGDKLIICMNVAQYNKSPQEFTAKEGSGQRLVELKREKK